MKRYDEPGRARRQCLECKKYVHVRALVCPCGADMKENAEEVKQRQEAELTAVEKEAFDWAKAIGWHGKLTLTPAGECPFKLKGHTNKDVVQWVERLITHGYAKKKMYSPNALRYFVRTQYNWITHPEEHDKVKKFVNKHIDKYMSGQLI